MYFFPSPGLGFNIQGGIDSPYIQGEKGIYVVKIRSNGAAAKDGRLNEGDQILSVRHSIQLYIFLKKRLLYDLTH